MDLSTLDSIAKDLEASLDRWTFWLWLSTAAVAAGLLVEYIPETVEFIKLLKRTRRFWRRKLFTVMGGVLITVGVVGELGVAVMSSSVETKLRAARHDIEAVLNKEASDARKDAGDANERAGKAAEHASLADERAANAEKEAARLKKAAEDEKLARVKIEERIRPRRLSPRQREVIRAALSPYSGARVRISTVADDAESFNLGADIKDAVSSAGWLVAFFGPVTYLGPSASQLPSGVEILVGGMLNAPAIALLKALRHAFTLA